MLSELDRFYRNLPTRSITAANGQTYSGKYVPDPGAIPRAMDWAAERLFQIDLAVQLNGIMEVTITGGRIDIVTKSLAIEVKARWRQAGAVQAAGYGERTGLIPVLAVPYRAIAFKSESHRDPDGYEVCRLCMENQVALVAADHYHDCRVPGVAFRFKAARDLGQICQEFGIAEERRLARRARWSRPHRRDVPSFPTREEAIAYSLTMPTA